MTERLQSVGRKFQRAPGPPCGVLLPSGWR